jgi:hypothetical protein
LALSFAFDDVDCFFAMIVVVYCFTLS